MFSFPSVFTPLFKNSFYWTHREIITKTNKQSEYFLSPLHAFNLWITSFCLSWSSKDPSSTPDRLQLDGRLSTRWTQTVPRVSWDTFIKVFCPNSDRIGPNLIELPHSDHLTAQSRGHAGHFRAEGFKSAHVQFLVNLTHHLPVTLSH